MTNKKDNIIKENTKNYMDVRQVQILLGPPVN